MQLPYFYLQSRSALTALASARRLRGVSRWTRWTLRLPQPLQQSAHDTLISVCCVQKTEKAQKAKLILNPPPP